MQEHKVARDGEAGSRARSDFLGIMSHELRTPLNAILGYSELMELGISGDLTEVTRKQVGRIRLSAKHLLALVNDILDLAKVEAGRLPINTLPTSVSETLTAAVSMIECQAEAKKVHLAITPGSEALPTYIGDDERVRQILANLLSNAVKCTGPGGRVTVDAEVAPPAEGAVLLPRAFYICISVTDTGCGIPKEKLEAIFEPFVQADMGLTRSQEGSGLGLTIGRGLARAMGGDLTVVSKLDVGSRFTLWLPTEVRGNGDKPKRVDVPGSELSNRLVAREGVHDGQDGDRQVRGLAEIANKVLAELEPILCRIVASIRSDRVIRPARDLRTSQVADHLSSLIADMLSSLAVIEEASGRPSQILADAVEIQRVVADRHGAQRARLGWNEQAIRREFAIIREELTRLIQEAVPAGGELTVSEATRSLGRFVDQAEHVAVRALNRECGL